MNTKQKIREAFQDSIEMLQAHETSPIDWLTELWALLMFCLALLLDWRSPEYLKTTTGSWVINGETYRGHWLLPVYRVEE